MLGLFLNPGFLLIGIALISVPIIIHLINRMRFKRIRWAAMEFLLKAQKRTRRRLIIEQLLLLALRCLLIGLVGLLVSRFVGCGDTNIGGKPNLHFVLLDDSPSMQDHWKLPDGTTRNCFDVAKEDVLIKQIAKNLSLSKSNDQLILLPLSKVNDPEFQQPKPYERLNDNAKHDELKRDINELKPSMVHVSPLEGVKAAQKIIGNYPQSQVRLHMIGDFRHSDWGLPANEVLYKALLDMTKNNREMKIRVIDTVHPQRASNQGGFPASHDNVGILDVRPSTRIVGKNMPVQFTVSVHNFSGKQVEAKLVVRNEISGKDLAQIDFNPQNPIKLSPSITTNVSFEHRFTDADLEKGNPFAHLSVRLTNAALLPLENDGLYADNLRHTVVEVRDKVPILVIDAGDRLDSQSRLKREEDRDFFFLSRSLQSVPGASYQVVYGEDLAGGGNPLKALERADLLQYPTIFILNVREFDLKTKQLANLENYVRDGGGLAFFMGPLVNVEFYNKHLYKEGKGIFPAPMKGPSFFPPAGDKELEQKPGDNFKLLIREEKFADPRLTPIFGAMFSEPAHREPLRDLTIRRYFQVDRSAWKQEPGRVFELATLPNDAAVDKLTGVVVAVTTGENVKAILANPELAKYHARLLQQLDKITKLVEPGSEYKAFHVAAQIQQLLTDKGNTQKKDAIIPDMTELFANPDAKVQALRRDLTNLREDVNYGDPFVVASNFGKGKSVAIMSTAGKDWNDWGGGSAASVLYAPFIWEMQNYLSSQGDEANLTVGTTIDVSLDAGQFKGAQLKMVRYFMKPQHEKDAVKVKLGDLFGKEDGSQVLFTMTKNYEPGLYISEVIDDNAPLKGALTTYAHAFNVDTAKEGQLQRVGSDDLEKELVSKGEKRQIVVVGANAQDGDIIGKINDLSESPWLFLIFLFVLVAEQALAVHLSFHMKASEDAQPVAGRDRGLHRNFSPLP